MARVLKANEVHVVKAMSDDDRKALRSQLESTGTVFSSLVNDEIKKASETPTPVTVAVTIGSQLDSNLTLVKDYHYTVTVTSTTTFWELVDLVHRAQRFRADASYPGGHPNNTMGVQRAMYNAYLTVLRTSSISVNSADVPDWQVTVASVLPSGGDAVFMPCGQNSQLPGSGGGCCTLI
jgi:hypothetical protein